MTIKSQAQTPGFAPGIPHLTADEQHSLRRIVERLIRAYSPQEIYLFGSKARNDSGPDSDFDLLVIVPDSASYRQRESRLAYEVLRGTGIAADVLVWTSSAFQRRAGLPASLPATVMREGRLLYGA